MRHRLSAFLMAISCFLIPVIAAHAETTVYVNFASGQDIGGHGTRAKPYKTISYALDNGVPKTLDGAYTILVTDSDRTISYDNILIVDKATTATNTLTIKAKHPRIPIIKGRNINKFSVTIRVDNNYVTIDGFTLQNEGCDNGIFHFKGYSGGLYDGSPANPTTETTQVASLINCDIDGENIKGVGNMCVVFPANPHMNVTIANNRFYDCPVGWYLIYLKCSCPGAKLTIADNEIYNCTNAIFSAIKKVEGTGACESLIFERNRVYANHATRKIGMFDIISKATVRNNLIYDNTGYTNLIWLRDDRSNTGDGTAIYNNTVYNNDGNLIRIDGEVTGCSVKNNILCAKADGKYCIHLEKGAQTGFTSAANLFHADFDNDGIYDRQADCVAFKLIQKKGWFWGKTRGTGYLLEDWQSTYGIKPHYSLFGTPNFASTDSDDVMFLHITDSLPCRDKGVDITGMTDDFDGHSRPVGHYDIGADEFVEETSLR